MNFQPGDAVRWSLVCRGGYGYVILVPATVVKVTAKRVTIDAKLMDGTTRRISVKPEYLRKVNDGI